MLLRKQQLRKQPATGEFLVWLRTLALLIDSSEIELQAAMMQLEDQTLPLPNLNLLLKDRDDLKSLS